jgi:hypothetical protein
VQQRGFIVERKNGKKGQQACCRRNRERVSVGVCVHCEKTRLASIENGRLESLVCELLFTTVFIQGTYLNCEKGERKGRERKIIKLTRQNSKIIEGRSGTLMQRLHFAYIFHKIILIRNVTL